MNGFVPVPKEEEGQVFDALKRNLCVGCYTWVGTERIAEGNLYCVKCDPPGEGPDFTLGQRVKYRHHILRRHSQPGEFLGPNKIWSSVPYPGARTGGGEGIIVGKRTLSDGHFDHGWGEDPGVYSPRHHFTAWLVATSLRHKHVYVLPHHIILEES